MEKESQQFILESIVVMSYLTGAQAAKERVYTCCVSNNGKT
jgi:hypothetical protein